MATNMHGKMLLAIFGEKCCLFKNMVACLRQIENESVPQVPQIQLNNVRIRAQLDISTYVKYMQYAAKQLSVTVIN